MVSQGQRNKRNGTKFESDLVKYFREAWDVEADRLRLSGTTDEGDILVRLPNGKRLVVEAKSGVNWRPKEWLREAEVETKNYAKHRNMADEPPALVVMKKHNFNINQAYVMLSIGDLEDLILR